MADDNQNVIELNDKERESIKEIFDLFDKDKSGSIDAKELADVLRASGNSLSNDDIKALMDEFDKDKSETIDFEEFIQMYCKRFTEPATEDELLEAFKIFDRDGNGVLTKDELKDIMTKMGDPLSDEEAEEFLKQADLDGDGKINYKEFCRLICQE